MGLPAAELDQRFVAVGAEGGRRELDQGVLHPVPRHADDRRGERAAAAHHAALHGRVGWRGDERLRLDRASFHSWAHQYCPNAILLINDYNTIENASDNANIIKIVNAIKKVGAPINAVGAQAHAVYSVAGSSASGVNTVKGYIDAIATQTGLPVYISEYDINVADDTTQKNDMQAEFTMFWNDPNVKGVTLWGYIEGATWETNTGLMSSSGTMRPAMTWLMQFLGRP